MFIHHPKCSHISFVDNFNYTKKVHYNIRVNVTLMNIEIHNNRMSLILC